MLNHSIAFAGSLLQILAGYYLDSAAHVFNQAIAFENTGGQSHAGTSGAQHLRQEFVSERQKFRIDPILAHQQPARQALVYIMKAVAGGELRNLHSLHEGETTKLRAQGRAARQDSLKHFRRYPRSAS